MANRFFSYGNSRICFASSISPKQATRYVRFIPARMPQGWPEKSIPSVLPITTPTPSKKNQGVNMKAADWRIAMMTKSCRPPETTKVKMRASQEGKLRWKGEYTYFPKPYPQTGFQYCQKPAKVPAPKERYSIFWRERGAPKGTPFCLRTYWASVKRCRDISKWGEGLSRSSFMYSFCIAFHLG